MKAIYALALSVLLVLGVPGPVAHAQPRGGPPSGIPGGGPIGEPGTGIGMGQGIDARDGRGGPLSDLPGEADQRAREAAVPGLERAQTPSSAPLGQAQKERAARLAGEAPDSFELDSNSALIVKGEVLAAGLDTATLARLERAGFAVLREQDMPELGMTLFTLSTNGMAASDAIRKLRRLAPRGVYAPNHVLFESGKAGGEAQTASAPAVASTSAPARVGLIDTGVSGQVDQRPHLKIVRRGFAPGGPLAREHGSAVASLIAREPGPVEIYAADIFGSGGTGGTSEYLIRALAWLAGEQTPVINISLIGPANPIAGAAIENLIARGFVIVAPVGNDGPAARPLFPASYLGVIAVSGAGADGRLLPEASRVKRVDFVAPGIATVPGPNGEPTTVRGTSFAAPLVARLIADRLRAPTPRAAREAVRALARSAVRPKDDRGWYGSGKVGTSAPVLSGN